MATPYATPIPDELTYLRLAAIAESGGPNGLLGSSWRGIVEYFELWGYENQHVDKRKIGHRGTGRDHSPDTPETGW